MKTVNELCKELAQELNRLSGCAVDNAEKAKTNPDEYVAATSAHFARLMVDVADIKRAHAEEVAGLKRQLEATMV